MTQYVINIGAIPNDGTGDPLRTAFNETNLNFNQIFAAGPVLSNIQIANNKILTTNTNGNLVLAPNGTGVVQSNVSIIPNTANIRNLGSSTQRWATVYTQYINVSGASTTSDLTVNGNLTVQGNIIQVGNIVTETLTIQLANAASTANAANGSGITVGANDNIATLLYNSTGNVWTTNIGVSSVGNISAPYFFGNGSQLTGLPATYSNANVVTLLAGFGSNTISTTGNISGGFILGNLAFANGLPATYSNANVVAYGQSGWAGNIIPSGNAVYSLGNATNQWNDLYVSNATIFMNNVPISLGAGNVLTVNGNAVLQNDSNTSIATTGNITAGNISITGGSLTWSNASIVQTSASDVSITGDGQVTVRSLGGTYQWTFDGYGNLSAPGNINATGNVSGAYVKGNGSGLTNLPAPAVTQDITSNGAMSIMTYDGVIKYVNYATVEPSSGNITGGNILTGGLISATGNISGGNLISPTLNNSGNISVVASGNAWTFGTNGSLTFPIGVSIDSSVSPVYPKIIADSGKLFSVQGQGANGSAALAWSLNPNTDTKYAAVGVNQGGGDSLAKVVLTAGNTTPELKVWKFDETGNITLPRGGIVYETSIPGGALTGNTIALKPQGGIDADQQLLIYPTAGPVTDDNHLHLTTGNLYNTELYLGDDYLYVKLANTGNVVINSNDGAGNSAQWTFDNTGNLVLPQGGVIDEQPNPGGFPGYSTVIQPTGYINPDQKLVVYPTGGVDYNHLHLTSGNLYNTELFLGNDNLYVKLANTGNVEIRADDSTGNAAVWTFDREGGLTLPGNLVVATGIVGSGASPAPYLSGFSSVSAITLSASGNVVATGNITGGNLITSGSGGNITLTGGNITGANVVTANSFVGNGATLSNVATQVTGSWTVPVGNSTQSFTVSPNETYYLWVDCNIPNGILAWNATATVTNTNVPVVGAQYAWVYTGGGTPVDFTSIPNQFVGTANTIVRSSVAPSATTNRFDFGINNTSGNAVTVNYGYTKIS